MRMLLIGHLDTVVEPGGANWVREDSTARGVGSNDMKGGDVIILYALKALEAAGALRDLNLTIVFTGDEESAGTPLLLDGRTVGFLGTAVQHYELGPVALAVVKRTVADGTVLDAAGTPAAVDGSD